MARYSVSHQTPAGANKPIILITGSAAVRVHLYDMVLGSDATPADVAGEFIVERCTNNGTDGTALTEVKLDPLTVAATSVALGGTFAGSGEPAASDALLMIGLNQRATFRWIAAPGGELISTATADHGLELRTVAMSSGTPNMNATLMWWE